MTRTQEPAPPDVHRLHVNLIRPGGESEKAHSVRKREGRRDVHTVTDSLPCGCSRYQREFWFPSVTALSVTARNTVDANR